jgi:hypothetical protein
MKRGPLASALAASFVLVLGGCDNGPHTGETDVIGTVVLAGVPVDSANVRIVFAGFVQDTGVTAPDGTFIFDHFPEEWVPFFVEAFYIDPVTLNEYYGHTPFLDTEEHGPTDVGDIVLVQTFPATAGNGTTGDLDGDGTQDVAVAYPDQIVVALSSGESRVLTKTDAASFVDIVAADVDGDGMKDLLVTRAGTTAPEVWMGDGKGGFLLAKD